MPGNAYDYQKSLAENSNGETYQRISNLARQYQIHIVYGFTEISDGELYNSQILIDPDGEIESIHRKNFIIGYDYENGFKKGDEINIVEIDGINTAMLICADYKYLPVLQELQKKDFSLVIHSTAFNGNFDFNPDMTARRFNTWNICANRIGDERVGSAGDVYHFGTYISDPTGHIWAGSAGSNKAEGYIYYEIRIKIER